MLRSSQFRNVLGDRRIKILESKLQKAQLYKILIKVISQHIIQLILTYIIISAGYKELVLHKLEKVAKTKDRCLKWSILGIK